MAHYRKIDVVIWNDAEFSALKPVGKLAFFMLITHPSMTAIGAMRATLPGLSIELGVDVKDFAELFNTKLAMFDKKSNCVFVPNFLRYQSIDSPSPNVVKGWVKQSEFIPEGNLKTLAIENILSFLEGKSDSFRKAFDDSFLKVYGKPFQKGNDDSIRNVGDKTIAKPVSSKQLAVSSNKSKAPFQDEVHNPPTELTGGNSGEKIDADGVITPFDKPLRLAGGGAA